METSSGHAGVCNRQERKLEATWLGGRGLALVAHLCVFSPVKIGRFSCRCTWELNSAQNARRTFTGGFVP